jgi:hypothetical protein
MERFFHVYPVHAVLDAALEGPKEMPDDMSFASDQQRGWIGILWAHRLVRISIKVIAIIVEIERSKVKLMRRHNANGNRCRSRVARLAKSMEWENYHPGEACFRPAGPTVRCYQKAIGGHPALARANGPDL